MAFSLWGGRATWDRAGKSASGGGSPAQIQWLVADQLGTPRMIFDKTGSLASTKRHDYLPFGEELYAGVGGRTNGLGYTGDTIRQQFTLKERDNETGLDYFGARYYSNAQGRFTSFDPENAGASPVQPQSWNGYAYSLNNPLRYIDPDGLRWAQIVVDGGITYRWFDHTVKDDNRQTEYDRALASGYSAVTFDESQSFSFTNGLFAPGQTLETVTLTTDGKALRSYHTVTWGEYAKFLAISAVIDIGTAQLSPLGVKPTDGVNQLLGNYISSIVGVETNISANLPSVPGPAVGSSMLTKSEQRKLGNLASRANEKVADVIRSRGGAAANVRRAGPWAEKTLAETAKAATSGDRTAETAIKVAKEARRLGQKN